MYGSKDRRRHQAAWNRDGIVIDSSAKAIKSKRHRKPSDQWTVLILTLLLFLRNRKFSETQQPIEAMRRCLVQLAERPIPVFSLYRKVRNGEICFYEGLKWDITPERSAIIVCETVGDSRESIISLFYPKPAMSNKLAGPKVSGAWAHQ